jgi:hypothetical protein
MQEASAPNAAPQARPKRTIRDIIFDHSSGTEIPAIVQQLEEQANQQQDASTKRVAPPVPISINPPTQAKSDDSSTPPAGGSGVSVRVINGKIVLDESSLQFDRVEASAFGNIFSFIFFHHFLMNFSDNMEVIQENKFSRYNTRPKRTAKWTPPLTEKFFDCLRKYGQDFTTIEQLFPGFTRTDLKNKFRREERKDPDKITYLLLNPLVPDESEFKETLDRAEQAKKEKAKKEEELFKSMGISQPPAKKMKLDDQVKAAPADDGVSVIEVVDDADHIATQPIVVKTAENDDRVQRILTEEEIVEEAEEAPAGKKSALELNDDDDDDEDEDDDEDVAMSPTPLDLLRRDHSGFDREYEDSIY